MNYGAGTGTSTASGYKSKDKLDINDPYTVILIFIMIIVR